MRWVLAESAQIENNGILVRWNFELHKKNCDTQSRAWNLIKIFRCVIFPLGHFLTQFEEKHVDTATCKSSSPSSCSKYLLGANKCNMVMSSARSPHIVIAIISACRVCVSCQQQLHIKSEDANILRCCCGTRRQCNASLSQVLRVASASHNKQLCRSRIGGQNCQPCSFHAPVGSLAAIKRITHGVGWWTLIQL